MGRSQRASVTGEARSVGGWPRGGVGVMWLAFALALTLASARRSMADTWYVNNRFGDDARDGRLARSLGASGPFRSIARALRAAGPGDRIVLANTGTPYREYVTLQGGRHSGSSETPFELVGNGAVLDGQQDVPAEAWHHVEGNIFAFRPRRMGFQTLYLDGKRAKRVVPARGAKDRPDLPARSWCYWRGEVHFAVEEGRLPQQYRLTHGGLPVGITLYEVRNVLIRDLTIRGYQLDGINAHDGVRFTLLADVVCEGNGRSGVSVGGASRVTMLRCRAEGNGAAQVRAESAAKVRLSSCHVAASDGIPGVVREDRSVVHVVPR